MKWTNIHKKGQHQRLFQPTSYLGAEKTVSFKNQDDFTIRFYQHVPSSENVSPGSAEKDILTLTANNLTASVAQLKEKFGCTDGDIDAKFSVRLSAVNGMVEITKAFVGCEVDDTEKKGGVVDGVKGLFGFGSKRGDQEPLAGEDLETAEAVNANGDSTTIASSSASSTSSASATKGAKASKEEKPKPAKRMEIINLDISTEIQGYPQLSAKDLNHLKDRLQAFDDSDRSRRLREEALNQLEGFTYKSRDLLSDDSFIDASTAAERESLEAKSHAASEWLYGEGADAGRDDLKSRLMELRDIVGPIEKRKEEAAKRPEQMKLFNEALNQTKHMINAVKEEIAKQEAAAFSASSQTSTLTTEAPSTETDDFAGLEDEEASSTTTSSKPSATPIAPLYSMEDLTSIIALYDSAVEWFATQSTAQSKLSASSDPVLLIKDLTAKAKELNQAGIDLVTKTMNRAPKPKKSSSSKSTKSSKMKKAKSTSTTASADKVKPTFNVDFSDEDMEGMFDLGGEDGEMLNREEILARVKAQEAKWKTAREQAIADEGEEGPHDEL